VTVHVGTIETADGSGFYVGDDGAGIPADEREPVLEWGQTTAAEATGFGRAMVTGIVDAREWERDVRASETRRVRFEIPGSRPSLTGVDEGEPEPGT